MGAGADARAMPPRWEKNQRRKRDRGRTAKRVGEVET
jgi:hypothetical protein